MTSLSIQQACFRRTTTFVTWIVCTLKRKRLLPIHVLHTWIFLFPHKPIWRHLEVLDHSTVWEYITKQSTHKRTFISNGLKLLPIGLMFRMLVLLFSSYSIAPRIENNNFILNLPCTTWVYVHPQDFSSCPFSSTNSTTKIIVY